MSDYCAGFGEWGGVCPNRAGLCERCRKAHDKQRDARAIQAGIDRAVRRKKHVYTAETLERLRAAGRNTAAMNRAKREGDKP